MQPKIQIEAIAQAAEDYKEELLRINGASMLPLDDVAALAKEIDSVLSENIVERLLWSKFGRGFVIGYIGGRKALLNQQEEEGD
jgi:hypothetical protein